MSSLKKLLRAKGGDKKLVSLEETIYRAVKDKPERNIFNMLKAVNKLQKVIQDIADGKYVDFDKLNSAYLHFVSEYLAEGKRDLRKFHPSSLRHDCERKMFYAIGNYEFTDEVKDNIDGRTQMIFDTGHWFHSYIQAALTKAGIMIQSEVPVVDKKRFIGGRMDGKIIWNGEIIAIEIKSMNSFRFAKGKIAPFDDNVFQNSFYANHLGIKKILFLYYNKDTSEIKVHLRDTNVKFAEIANEIIDDVLEAVETDTAPKRKCKGPTDDLAAGCVFKSLCFAKTKRTIEVEATTIKRKYKRRK